MMILNYRDYFFIFLIFLFLRRNMQKISVDVAKQKIKISSLLKIIS